MYELLDRQRSVDTADESSVSEDEVSASLDELVSPDESSDEDELLPPLPPPPQEIKSKLKSNNIRRERIFFIFLFFERNNIQPITYLALIILRVF